MTGLHSTIRTTRRRAVAVASACALAAGALVGFIVTPADAQAGCEVDFNASEWGDGNGGFTAHLTPFPQDHYGFPGFCGHAVR